MQIPVWILAGMKTFRPYQPDQLLLLPPSIQEWLPEHHLARFVSEVMDELDLSAIEERYTEERGYPPYHPRMMVKVLVYGYCTGTYASRRLTAKLHVGLSEPRAVAALRVVELHVDAELSTARESPAHAHER